MAFDYFSVHLTSLRILEAVHAAIDARMLQLFGPGYLDDMTQLHYLVGYIFMASSSKESWPDVDPMELLRLAAPAVESVFLEEGHRVRDRMADLDGHSIITQYPEDSDDEPMAKRREGH